MGGVNISLRPFSLNDILKYLLHNIVFPLKLLLYIKNRGTKMRDMKDKELNNKATKRNNDAAKNNAILLVSIALLTFASLLLALTTFTAMESVLNPEMAYATITVGNSEINGYQPSDIVSTDANVNTESLSSGETTAKLEQAIINITKIILPILMIACVAIIIYNAVRNLFAKPEKKRDMGELIKNMFIQFAFIFFAWLIVEGIVFIITGGEAIIYSSLFS